MQETDERSCEYDENEVAGKQLERNPLTALPGGALLSDPAIAGGRARLTADYGTAPAACVEELLDRFSEMAIEEVSLGRAVEE